MSHVLKYWKDYINYRKFLLGSEVAALHYRKRCNENLLKACFDAMKHNKETEKFIKHDTILN